MNDERRTLRGWPAVRTFLMLAATPVLTALTMALPIKWLVNLVFGTSLIHAIFASDHFGYWQCVGMYAIWFAAKGRIKWTVKI